MSMKHCYLFSGLGVDERVFQYVDLPDCNVHFIKWIPPVKKESIEDYASRLLAQIETVEPVLVGLSFGGMVAIEVAKLIKTEKVILISSAKTKNEIPFYYRLAGMLNLHQLLPAGLMKQGNFISYWIFGISNKRDKELLNAILKDTDAGFLTWAIDKIVNWKNTRVPNNLIHIHGTADRILPIGFVAPDERIVGGGHFMVVDKAGQVSELLRKYLARVS